jgi:hypothetical protein
VVVPLRILYATAALAIAGQAEIIDRVAVSVGNSAITTSDLEREIRVTGLLNGVHPDFSSATKRATAERMVEQKMVQHELELSRYPAPDASAMEEELDEFRKAHYKTDSEFQQALADSGVTLQEVKDELLWQLTLLRFIEIRFRPAVHVSESEIQDYFEKTVKPAAQAAHPGQAVTLDDYYDDIEDTLAGERADKQLDKWLQETRQRTEIVYHEETLQ